MTANRLGLVVAVLLLAMGCNEGNFNTFDTPPSVVIQEPLEGSVIESAATSINFWGTVFDEQDMEEELEITWSTTAQEEPFFTGYADTAGNTEIVETLEAGDHTITLKVVDTAGHEATDAVDITVEGEPDDPVDPAYVEIVEPLQTYLYYYADPIHFLGLVEGSQGPAALEVEWLSGLDGVLYSNVANEDGETSFDSLLTAGVHVITLRAGYTLDPAVGVGDASITIQVGDTPLGEMDQDGDGYCPDGIDGDGDGDCEGAELTGPGSQDCNDFDDHVCPGCPEVCDGQDNDCDGHIDVNELDQDGDGQSPCAGDCDDADPINFTGNPEICDGFDNDCDELVDDEDPSINGQQTWYDDLDGDTYGDPLTGVTECFGEAGTVSNGDDCDDTNVDVNPGEPEICDTIDNNCNGSIDEGFDADHDGVSTCDGDCDDNDANVYPGAPEYCDELDNDCDGIVNEDFADSYETYETSPSDPGYELTSINPTLTLGSGSCDFTIDNPIPFLPDITLNLTPGTSSIAGGFHAPDDLWDIYYFDTDLTTNLVEWAAFLISGQTLHSSCTAGEITFSSNHQIMVTAYVAGTPYSATGYSGNINFQLSIWDLFDIDYEIIVEPIGTWIDCNQTYTLNFEIP